jgi:hypothetical protein
VGLSFIGTGMLGMVLGLREHRKLLKQIESDRYTYETSHSAEIVFDFQDLSPEHKAQIPLGMKTGEAKIEQYLKDGQKVVNGWGMFDVFGDRAFFN